MGENLPAGEYKALKAVADGKVERIYRPDGNVFKQPAGVSTKSLWSLYRKGMIRDAEESSGRYEIHCKMELTKVGEAELTKPASVKAGERSE